MINVTDVAAEKITELLAEEQKTGAGLRVFVQGGGCAGFQYGLMIDEGEGDPESDQTFVVNGVRLFVDPISLRYLKGAEVDFVDNNMGGGFTIKNPNAKSTCGCGSSFSACRLSAVSIPSATEFVDQHRPAGGRRSDKRDVIVTIFLQQEGHIGADALVDLVRRQASR